MNDRRASHHLSAGCIVLVLLVVGGPMALALVFEGRFNTALWVRLGYLAVMFGLVVFVIRRRLARQAPAFLDWTWVLHSFLIAVAFCVAAVLRAHNRDHFAGIEGASLFSTGQWSLAIITGLLWMFTMCLTVGLVTHGWLIKSGRGQGRHRSSMRQ